jgi:tRNA 2-thiouridine synthesizing protein A
MKPVTLDTRGLMCPEPIIKAEAESARFSTRKELNILATDPASPIDFEVWCMHKNHRYLGYEELDDWLEIKVILNPA